MQQIEYKRGFATIKVGYAKGIIEYGGKKLSKNEITGFGIGTGMGSTLRKSSMKPISKNTNLKTIGGNMLNQMDTMLVIAYKNPNEEKISGLYIPIMIKDPVCLNSLNK